jgi:hypothetical protein
MVRPLLPAFPSLACTGQPSLSTCDSLCHVFQVGCLVPLVCALALGVLAASDLQCASSPPSFVSRGSFSVPSPAFLLVAPNGHNESSLFISQFFVNPFKEGACCGCAYAMWMLLCCVPAHLARCSSCSYALLYAVNARMRFAMLPLVRLAQTEGDNAVGVLTAQPRQHERREQSTRRLAQRCRVQGHGSI